MKKLMLACGLAAAVLGSATSASAAAIFVSVDGQAQPWLWDDGTGFNSAFEYGVLDGIGPAVVDATDGIAVVAGNTIDVAYLAGLTDAFGNPPSADALGHQGFDASNNAGSTGEVFPSFYMSPYPIYLNALVGTFADALGNIVGNPFHVGLGGSFLVPLGATQLQLGVNDDFFSDNVGSLRVCVSDSGDCPASVPEPVSVALFALGFGGMAARALRRRRA
jgi:hypothetical protein